jgi:hypothetical protein
VGSNLGILPRVLRAKMLLEGRFRRWTDMYMTAIEACRPPLTPRSRAVLDVFRNARREGLMARVSGVRRSGVYRQTRLGNIGLFVGAVLNKI